MKKIIFIIAILIFTVQLSSGQVYSCINENSGIDTSGTQNLLKISAQNLKAVFPSIYQNSFKLFSTSFYLHTEDFAGKIPAAFQNAIEVAQNNSTYYLLIG